MRYRDGVVDGAVAEGGEHWAAAIAESAVEEWGSCRGKVLWRSEGDVVERWCICGGCNRRRHNGAC